VTAIGYPSDLSDDEWKLVEPLQARRRQTHSDHARDCDGLIYILSTGCQWRAIPKDLPPRSTSYDYFGPWSWDGSLDLIHHKLDVQRREAIGREPVPRLRHR
jgi:transposase